ncbi:hypothetical protein RchiOBHm_Chr6g0252731 [Rosa chinensis]|uniref:Uncharacterized protein n=1 Tax=Rosa chinensis TaxID=74649 RepID=A0A2P6PL52_ROSCH|nr:myosin-2 heavy chain isoform X1 [Rosa chinensis]PRQ22664.1 hypothetical protein RchiOBHm_Chr6g0252731 [Rosa chinensis]
MDEDLSEKESLLSRIQQVEHERDELRKDIEQLCMQQAGPGYLVVATKMHFQRTAGLEQEIENLKKKLATCSRENVNLQEELSEAYRIKGQLADLHNAEVAKNLEAEKQLKFFQGCVAAAFAERDQSIMEAETAREKEELMSKKLSEIEKRLEEHTADCFEQKKLNDKFQTDLAMQEEQNATFKKVIDKFYEIRQDSLEGFGDTSWDTKCACLLDDPAEWWSFNDTSTSKYISSLEEELERVRISAGNLQNRLRVGLEIENHLKRRVSELEKKKIRSDGMIKKEMAELHHHHSQQKVHIMSLLNEGSSCIKSIIDAVEKKCRQIDASRLQKLEPHMGDVKQGESECQDVHEITDADPQVVFKDGDPSLSDMVAVGEGDFSRARAQALQDKVFCKDGDPSLSDMVSVGEGDSSKALAQALEDKVATLLLLSQQEERHLLDRNVNAALQSKIDELQRNLLQVTNEKVQALMEMAQLKQEYHQLKERMGQETKGGNSSAQVGDRRVVTHERGGKLKSLLKKTYLSRWVGNLDLRGNEAESDLNSMEFVRMKIENATLRETIGSIEHLTTTVHRLRLSLLKAKEMVTSGDSMLTSMLETLDNIINEAKLVKTALGSSLPLSWSAEADVEFSGHSVSSEPGIVYWEPSHEKIDSVYAVGFEMVELLILASQILKDNTSKSGS